jgi:hypothetical protein
VDTHSLCILPVIGPLFPYRAYEGNWQAAVMKQCKCLEEFSAIGERSAEGPLKQQGCQLGQILVICLPVRILAAAIHQNCSLGVSGT